jgi:glycosyltransferase involved in cell wall biosynthesis
MPLLSIVIPAYNEQNRISKALSQKIYRESYAN